MSLATRRTVTIMPYCHDSELTWLGWNQSKSTQQLHHFVQSAIAYRKVHPMLHQATELLVRGAPEDPAAIRILPYAQ